MNLKFSSKWAALIGGRKVWIGILLREEDGDDPVGPTTRGSADLIPEVYAAASYPEQLAMGTCAFGDSAASAVASWLSNGTMQ